MKFDLDIAIKTRKLLLFSDGPKLIEKEIKAAKDDIKAANSSYSQDSFKWATIQAYYSIFHLFRALLYNKGYREKSHIWLLRAVKHFYVDQNTLHREFYDNAINAMELRELADYKNKFTKQGAGSNIESATKTLEVVQGLLKIK